MPWRPLQLKVRQESKLKTKFVLKTAAVLLSTAALSFSSISPGFAASSPKPESSSSQKKSQTAKKAVKKKTDTSKTANSPKRIVAVKKNTTSKNTAAKTTKKRVRSPVTARKAVTSDVSKQRSTTQQRIEKLQASMAEAQTNRSNIQAELQKSEKEIGKVRQNLQNLQKERRVVEKDLRNQLRQKQKIEADMAKERKILAEIDKQRLEQIRLQDAPDWLGKSDPHQKARAEALLDLLRKKSESSYKKLEQQQKQLAQVVYQSRVSGEKLRDNVNSERQQQQKLVSERRERQRTVVRLEKDLAVKATTLKKLEQDEKRLAGLVTKLQSQKKIAYRPSSAAKDRLETGSGLSAAKSEVQHDPVLVSSGIPVLGKVAASYGQKRTGGNNMGNWKGVVFSVNEEQPVKAVRAGKVVFADYLRGYGNLLVIDHGGGYFTVYGNNSSMEKDIGDLVKAGEVISHVGSKESDLSVLYFELRHNGKPINPNKWLKL